MQQTKIDGLDAFLRIVENSRRAGSKEIRLPIDAAISASFGIAFLLSRIAALQEKIDARDAEENNTYSIDGGGLG